MSKSDVFKNILNQFETEELRLYCQDMIEKIPDYIFEIPSSTSLKYHNATQCQSGGQILHVIMVCTIMNYILELDYIKEKFPEPKKRDCMRVAACLHDAVKCGWNGSKYTVHEHPILASEWVKTTEVEHDIKKSLKEYIGRLIESHSGQWTSNKKSNVVLPKPENDEQFLVHLCDYLGSRNNLDMIYSEEEKRVDIRPTMPFGKYKGMYLDDVPRDYLIWCDNNIAIISGRLREYIDANILGV